LPATRPTRTTILLDIRHPSLARVHLLVDV
jgi:hypothetical protein